MKSTWECRGWPCGEPRHGHKHAGWQPFTKVWGPAANSPTKKKG